MMKTGNSYLIDTNVIIDFFGNDTSIVNKLSKIEIIIPFVVVGELYYGAYLSQKKEDRIKQVSEFINEQDIVYVNKKTSEIYGRIKSELKKSGNPIPENDIWISALAIENDVILVTRDKHFNKIENLKTEYW